MCLVVGPSAYLLALHGGYAAAPRHNTLWNPTEWVKVGCCRVGTDRWMPIQIWHSVIHSPTVGLGARRWEDWWEPSKLPGLVHPPAGPSLLFVKSAAPDPGHCPAGKLVFGHIKSVKIPVILNPAGYRLTSSGFAASFSGGIFHRFLLKWW